ncbi:MAG: serine/threonine protein kinase [Planctomycetes bacterium]|nr:serine/threonine protein kinase [Planctomycetota bacterium]MCH9725926.1 serine/threonine protein kinase [Planctomycetota bacterium]MCH9777079.1 serine/threonine protein kinase [Planctomycetota bacterium]MDF1744443.1 serine/threonine-protein kinase [Gimesia sp.]
MNTQEHESAPDRLGEYLIGKKIGAGGMGSVYLATNVHTDQQVAIKVLPGALAREPGFVERFHREIEALKKMHNPYVIEFYDSGVENEIYYYVMEYIEGETLTKRIRREKRIDWKTTVDISIQICSALKAAHDAGIIHRDLKPSNLILKDDNTVKLADFGVAQLFASEKLTVTGGIIGTAEYMSPEQAEGKRVTKQSDLYALGAVMYVMLTGKPPFSGKTMLAIIQKQKYGQFDRPGRYVDDLPIWLEEIVCQLLEKDPEKRFPDAYVLSRRLQEVLNKHELSNSDETYALSGSGAAAVTPTVVQSASEQEAGEGTLMQGLMRAQLESESTGSRLAQLFDNTYFLLGVLAVLIAGGYFWFQERQLSPQEMFDQAKQILQQPGNPEWYTARDKYLLPLLEADPLGWETLVKPELSRINTYELRSKAGMTAKRRSRTGPQNEPQRFISLAQHYLEEGDVSQAETILSALVDVLYQNTDQKEMRDLAIQMLNDLQNNSPINAQRFVMLTQSMSNADTLLEQKKFEEAAAAWKALIVLYDKDQDQAVKDIILNAKNNLKNLPKLIQAEKNATATKKANSSDE